MRVPLTAALVVILAGSLGCESSAPSGGAASSAAPVASSAPSAAATPSAVATPSEPAPAPPVDLDVAELQKAMKCATDAKSGPCGVLAQIKTCGNTWNAVSPGG